MTLHPLRGHEELRRGLARARERSTVPPSLLFHGAPGIGKQRTALWTGQLLLCTEPTSEGPCFSCKSCRLAIRLEHPDLHWFFPLPRPTGVSGPDRLAEALEDARSEALQERRSNPLRVTGSDEPRGLYLAAARTLRSQAHRRPSMGPVQVFIVAEAETLVPQESSPEAANALLKLLEEPPEGTLFILTSNEPRRLLPTIRSRSFPVHLSPLSPEKVERFLVEVAEAPPDEAKRAARLSRGSIGRALGFLPDDDDHGPLDALRREAYRLLQAGLSPAPGKGFEAALGQPVSGARGLAGLFDFMEEWLRDLAAVAAGAPERILNPDAREALEGLVDGMDLHPVDLARSLGAVEEARILASGNVNPQLIVAGLLQALRKDLVAGEEDAAPV